MKQIILAVLTLATTGVFAQRDTISFDSVAYWRTYQEATALRNEILRDSITYWRNRYNNAISTEYNRYSRNNSDSVYHNGRYIARKEYEKLNFETSFMPGAGYVYYKPKASDSLGSFGGIAIEYLFYGQVEQNDNPGPSHVRFYGKLNLQNSSKDGVPQMFCYGLGLDMSIEKNPKRTFLIPYFGLEAGGLTNKTLGSTLQFSPIVGLHVLSTRNLFINIHAGQVYTARNIDMLQGWFAQGTVNFSLW